MVKSVIFDFGGVLMDFPTRKMTAAFAENEEDARLLHQAFFTSPDWLILDRGGPEAQALAAIQGHLPSRLRDAAARAMERWDEFLTPKPEMSALARELDGLGVPLYILSNTSERFYRFRERLDVWPLMRGALLSCEEHLLKPDLEIYRRLFARFHLAPGECIFIDDMNANIEAARWCGMQAFHYQNDISRLRAALREAGIPAAER